MGKETYDEFLKEQDPIPAEFEQSEYWSKELPGIAGWTVGNLIEQLAKDGMLGEKTPAELYDQFEKMQNDEEQSE